MKYAACSLSSSTNTWWRGFSRSSSRQESGDAQWNGRSNRAMHFYLGSRLRQGTAKDPASLVAHIKLEEVSRPHGRQVRGRRGRLRCWWGFQVEGVHGCESACFQSLDEVPSTHVVRGALVERCGICSRCAQSRPPPCLPPPRQSMRGRTFAQKTKLALGFVGGGRIEVDASVDEVAVKICDKRSDVRPRKPGL